MATFLKRQKEMKRLEKQREKAERRAQKKLARRTPSENIGRNRRLGRRNHDSGWQ